jgi:membrane-associated protein
MDLLKKAIDIFLHLDQHLGEIIRDYGAWTYLILLIVIFCETGLVITPFLPGDSLLFAAGAFAAVGSLDITSLLLLLSIAAICGDAANYWIGYRAGPKVFHKESSRLLNKRHLERAHRFYEEHGGKTIIIARFVPIIRTFAPFVAGVGRMTYWKFATYNIVGGTFWVATCTLAGYFFGQIPAVKRNFSLVIAAIVLISLLPGLVEYLRQRRPQRAATPADP